MKDAKNIPRTRRKNLPSNYINVVVGHTGRPHNWEDRPGIEFWNVEALLCPDKLSARIVIATASLWRVDLQLCTDIVFDLDNISSDLGVMASAISHSEDRLTEHSLVVGNNSSILIAEDVVVDRFWRGNRLGSALLFFAADTLRADGIFLTPVALGTRLDASGVCFTDYYAPDRPASAKKSGNRMEESWFPQAGRRCRMDSDMPWIRRWT